MLETLKPVSKAIAGALAGAVVMWLAKNNVVIDDALADSLEVLIGAVITGVIVYLAPKNQGVK